MQLAGPSDTQWARSQLTDGVSNCYIPPIVLRESSNFVTLVREYNNGEVRDRFKQILKDHLIQQRSDVGGIVSRIVQLVEEHTELRQGFKRLQIAVKADDLAKKMEGRLAGNDVKRYFEILAEVRTGQISTVKMVEEIAALFSDHMDLWADFCGMVVI